MEQKIMKAVFRDLREKDIEISNSLSDALSNKADVEYLQEISAKSCVISDIRHDCKENKSLRRPFAYMQYLKNLHTVANEDYVSASLSRMDKSELHVRHAKLEQLTQLMFDVRWIVADMMDEILTAGIAD